MRKVGPRHGIRILHDLVGRPDRDDAASLFAGAGPEIHNPVRRAHDVFVMLHNDHRVAEVSQILERPDQPVSVSRMQANARLVEHVENAGQPGSNLPCKTNSLTLSARERIGASRNREIAESERLEALQSRHGSRDKLFADCLLVSGEFQALQPLPQG